MEPIIKYKDIIKRMISLSGLNNIKESGVVCDNLYNESLKNNNIYNIRGLFKEAAKCGENACNYAYDCAKLIDKAKPEYQSELKFYYMANILPKVSNNVLSNISTSSDIKDESIKESAKNIITVNTVCDRISANHNILKKYGTDSMFETSSKINDTNSIIELCCAVIDNFDVPVYAKINTSIEEMVYEFGEHDYSYNESELVNTVLNFYKGEYALEDYSDIANVLSTSNVLEGTYDASGDTKDTHYLDSKSEIVKALSVFTQLDDPQIEDFAALQSSICHAPAWDIKDNMQKFFDMLNNYITGNHFKDVIDQYLSDIFPKFFDMMYEKIDSTDEDIRELFSKIIAEIIDNNRISAVVIANDFNMIDIDDKKDRCEQIGKYIIVLNDLLNKFKDTASYMYTKYNVHCMRNDITAESTIISLNEFKLFKFNNLISYCININKYLSEKFKTFKTVGLLKISKVKSKIFKETQIYDVINPDGDIDYCIESLFVDDIDNSNIHEICTNLIKEVNNTFLKNTEYKCYYMINPDNVEFRIRSNESVDIDEDDKALIEGFNSEEDIDRMSIIMSMGTILDDNINFEKDIPDYLYKNRMNESFYQQAEIITTACSMIGFPKDSIDEMFNDTSLRMDGNEKIRFLGNTKNLVESYNPMDSDKETVLESLFILETFLNEDKNPGTVNPNKGNNIKNTVDNIKKNVKNAATTVKDNVSSKINDKDDKSKPDEIDSNKFVKGINSINLTLRGIADKAKNLGQKEKEMSRNADSTFNRLTKSVKDLLVSDRREAIIKGSVIPSFSKCVKIGIGLAGMGFVTQNPIIPAIALIGGIIASKKLTRKERMLMLDDLEVEIDVIDKEISLAESRNQLKKMRALMKTKKNIQRQYQRIKYNIRIGQDLLPAGLGTDDN